jgi:hypothetical protein
MLINFVGVVKRKKVRDTFREQCSRCIAHEKYHVPIKRKKYHVPIKEGVGRVASVTK